MEIDHIIPRGKGGPDNFLNYVPCEKRKNRKKNNALATNRKLVAVIYFVETVFGEQLESQIRQIREKAIRTRERKKAKKRNFLHVDEVEKDERSKVFTNFWYGSERKIGKLTEERLHTERFQALLDKYMPSWKERRNQLNELVF